MKKVVAVCLFVKVFILGCQSKPGIVSLLDSTHFTKTELGNSGYFVKHPTSMQLDVDEWYNKWQDSYFCIRNPDSLPPYSNTFAISLGLPDSAKAMGWDLPIIDRVQSPVMGSIIDWNIRKSDTEYFVADAQLRDIKFVTTSVTRSGIDSMIGCISTLSSR